MIDWRALASESSVAASPIWIRLRDAFTGAGPVGPVSVSLERRVGTDWIALAHRHQITSAGDLGFVNLGRTRDPAAVGTFDVRVTVGCPGMIPVASNGAAAVTATVTAWAPDAPAAASAPDDLSLYPSPTYAFPAGTPLLAGQAVDANGDPLPRARVWATESVQNAPITEEVRTDGEGRFRLPLRWSSGATAVNATHRGRAGAITVLVPADLSSAHQITLT